MRQFLCCLYSNILHKVKFKIINSFSSGTNIHAKCKDTEISPEIEEALINTKEQWGIAQGCKMTDRLSLGSLERQWEPGQSGQAIVEGGLEVTSS